MFEPVALYADKFLRHPLWTMKDQDFIKLTELIPSNIPHIKIRDDFIEFFKLTFIVRNLYQFIKLHTWIKDKYNFNLNHVTYLDAIGEDIPAKNTLDNKSTI